jgi:hypothetical protein
MHNQNKIRQYGKQKKPDTKCHILYDFFYEDRNQNGGFQRLGEKSRYRVNVARFPFGVLKIVWN